MSVTENVAIRFTPSEYPSVDAAYPLAIASYETTLKRFDAMDGRVQTLMTFAATLTVAFPALIAGQGLKLHPLWFVVAIALFAVGSVFGVIARFKGGIKTIDPGGLFQDQIGKNEWTFKKDLIYYAGLDFTENNTLLYLRHRLLLIAAIFYLFEFLCLAISAAYPWLALKA